MTMITKLQQIDSAQQSHFLFQLLLYFLIWLMAARNLVWILLAVLYYQIKTQAESTSIYTSSSSQYYRVSSQPVVSCLIHIRTQLQYVLYVRVASSKKAASNCFLQLLLSSSYKFQFLVRTYTLHHVPTLSRHQVETVKYRTAIIEQIQANYSQQVHLRHSFIVDKN